MFVKMNRHTRDIQERIAPILEHIDLQETRMLFIAWSGTADRTQGDVCRESGVLKSCGRKQLTEYELSFVRQHRFQQTRRSLASPEQNASYYFRGIEAIYKGTQARFD